MGEYACPTFAQVVGYVGDGGYIRNCVPNQFGLDRTEVIAQQVEDFLGRCYRLCAHSRSKCFSIEFLSIESIRIALYHSNHRS